MDDVDDDDLPLLHLPGTDLDTVNHTALKILVGVVGASIIGLLADGGVRQLVKGRKEDRPRGWVLGTLTASYMLLVPGLVMTLFSYKMAAVNGLYIIDTKSETMIDFIKDLWKSGACFGAFCIILFAMFIPAVKLALLVSAGLLRHSSRQERVTFSRRAIDFVQKISKWASPDMFAYIIFLNLVRGLNHPPALNGIMRLDLGFTCFSIFCVASTVSSLGVRSPPKFGVQEEGKSRFSKKVVAMWIAVAIFTIVFGVTLYHGLSMSCMKLRLDMNKLFESGKLSPSLKPIIELLKIQDLAAADVSLLDCMRNLQKSMWGTSAKGVFTYEVNAILGWIMIGVFVVGFTVLDMIALLVLAALVRVEVHRHGHRPWLAMEIVHVLRKLSMLDVAVVGVVIIIMAGQIYAKLGVVLSMGGGLAYLFVAELCHYGVYFLVTHMALAVPALGHKENDFGEEFEDDTTSCSSSDTESTEDTSDRSGKMEN